MNYADIPMVAPNDSVMASRQEVQQMLDWAAEVFAGAAPQDRFSFLGSRPPLSFIYDGEPSAKLLKTWARTVETRDKENYVEHQVRWTDRETGLQVTAVVTAFKRYPAVDWVIYFENQGTEDTPIIEDIQALDVELGADNPGEPAVLRQIKGDTEDEESASPFLQLPEHADHPDDHRLVEGACDLARLAQVLAHVLLRISFAHFSTASCPLSSP